MILYFLAQVASDQTKIEITPANIALLGVVIGIVISLIKLGDRLWGSQKEARKDKESAATIEFNDKLILDNIRHCETRNEKITDNINKLSEAMTKYIELQQAALKIEEYRHEAYMRQLEMLSGKIEDYDRKRIDDIKSMHNRLDIILQSVANFKK